MNIIVIIIIVTIIIRVKTVSVTIIVMNIEKKECYERRDGLLYCCFWSAAKRAHAIAEASRES